VSQRKVYEWVARIKDWLTRAIDSGQTSIVTCVGVKGEDSSAYTGQQRKSIDQSASEICKMA
jgi:gluconate kinase